MMAGAGILLVTANVGSLFEDLENLQKTWLREFYQTVQAHRPHFVAVHCQEVGGKNYEASMTHVDSFIKELLSSDAMKEFNRARIYLDKNYQSQEQFTALGCCYFLHESLKNIQQFDFKAKKFKKVVGKEIYSDTLASSSMLEKEKFPRDYFPECKWSRKGFIRTRWTLADWITDQRYDRLPYFLFGDFNFRLDSKQVIESLCSTASMQTVRAPDTNEVDKVIFRESDNDRKVVLQLEKKSFNYINQDVFRENNGTLLLQYDKELSVFKERLHELEISFPPSYPYSEDSSQGEQYMNTRCPAWCDRILMSASAKDLLIKSENEEKSIVYDNMGPNVCMGDHKPVFLFFRLITGAAKPHTHKHNCCVLQ
ncbi:inositol polyphosphate-5-phosphatase A-like isoform X2 [Xyrauchen texanus]|uniref:inositol polyphosphate-5-phosphatase A-like isoform X2 n=1 Tax=Xyrauchen texanus TaxID=154827 RepID=UPI002242B43D|nr:inositol polyphosphate-5-phosphatase A-like isoform X2 [Xyrauchen texanus]